MLYLANVALGCTFIFSEISLILPCEMSDFLDAIVFFYSMCSYQRVFVYLSVITLPKSENSRMAGAWSNGWHIK